MNESQKLPNVKEIGYKTSHIVWFHLYESSRTGKSIDTKQISSCLGLATGERKGKVCLEGPGFLLAVMKISQQYYIMARTA
jgi:hypothetical protein